MKYWVHMTRRYISTSILEKVHKAFFNHYQFHAMANMSDEIMLARMMTALDLEFEIALYYHDGGYESDNDYDCGFLPHITRLIHVYSMFSAEVSFNPADCITTKSKLSSFTSKHPRGLPFQEGVSW